MVRHIAVAGVTLAVVVASAGFVMQASVNTEAGGSTSPRDETRAGEWVTIPVPPEDTIRAWVAQPGRTDRAPIVLVIHDEAGLDEWVRSKVDDLAAQGFVAVAPDLLTGVELAGSGAAAVRNALESLDDDLVQRRIWAAGVWARALPTTTDRYGVLGFGWGGSVAFGHASRDAELGAAVVYDGAGPRPEYLRTTYAPILGLYAGEAEALTAEAAGVRMALERMGRTLDVRTFDGAEYGFHRNQSEAGAGGAGARAWAEAMSWLRMHLDASD